MNKRSTYDNLFNWSNNNSTTQLSENKDTIEREKPFAVSTAK